MDVDYQGIFRQAERTLIDYGSRYRPEMEIRAALDWFKTVGDRRLSDDEFFAILTDIVFYSGFRAATVDAKHAVIHRHFPDWHAVAQFSATDIQRILADENMIRHPGKIRAVVHNAKAFGEIIREYGSIQAYIDSFHATQRPTDLVRLKAALQLRFAYLGGITVYHFLTDIGFPVLKPDRVISRIFARLGITLDETDLQSTVIAGQAFAQATGLPIRYIDIVFVALGQVRSVDFGIDRGICLKTPRCHLCGLRPYCQFYQHQTS